MTTFKTVFANKWDKKLRWYECENFNGDSAGEVLVSVVLYQKGETIPELKFDENYQEEFIRLPQELFPQRKLARLEILFWGLRNLKIKCKAVSLTITVAGT